MSPLLVSLQVSSTSPIEVDDFCYGGKASLDYISDTWTSSKDNPTLHDVGFCDLEDFRRWAKEMHVGERISWAIGGIVLTVGLIFIRSQQLSHLSTQNEQMMQGKGKQAQQQNPVNMQN